MGKKEIHSVWSSSQMRQTLLKIGSLALGAVIILGLILSGSGIIVTSTESNSETSSPSESLGLLSSSSAATPSTRARFNLDHSRVRSTRQEDIFISVKTSGQFHQSRLDLVLKTWFTLARDETWFFTDQEDEEVNERANGHLRVTDCGSQHSRQGLSCKMAAEFDAYLESGKRWFCHFDDDNYVNVPALVRKLGEMDHRQDWYLGKPSLPKPLEIMDRPKDDSKEDAKNIQFWFATGGAGVCLSHALALKLLPLAGGGKFESVANRIRLPDDVTLGYLLEHVLETPLTVVDEFHSHLEPLRLVGGHTLSDQISFSYSKYETGMNVVNVENSAFSSSEDPTQFKSIHCKLFPNFSWCPRTE